MIISKFIIIAYYYSLSSMSNTYQYNNLKKSDLDRVIENMV